MQQHDGGIDPLEMIRVRPGIFIGGNDLSAIHYLLYQVIENSINQAESGQCSKLWVTLQPANAVMIKDDGPGIPVELYENSGRSILELIFTKELGRFDPQRSKFYPTMFGVGLPAVNALSEALRVEVARDGFLWQHNFEIGKAQGSLRQIRPLSSDEGTGTTITFTPDFTIFKRNEFSYSILDERLQDLAFLTPNLTITLRDERSDEPIESIFSYPEGLVAYVDYLRGEKLPVH